MVINEIVRSNFGWQDILSGHFLILIISTDNVLFFLGDRLAIISKGSLLCCGSFEYLKHHFGYGHRLTLVTKVQSDRRPSVSSRTFTITAEVEEPDHNVDMPSTVPPDGPIVDGNMGDELTNFIQYIVAGATMIERRGREVHYRLPLLQARPLTLARLFSQLDEKKEMLGIVSYGMTSCTMEEVSDIIFMYK